VRGERRKPLCVTLSQFSSDIHTHVQFVDFFLTLVLFLPLTKKALHDSETIPWIRQVVPIRQNMRQTCRERSPGKVKQPSRSSEFHSPKTSPSDTPYACFMSRSMLMLNFIYRGVPLVCPTHRLLRHIFPTSSTAGLATEYMHSNSHCTAEDPNTEEMCPAIASYH